WYELTSMPHRPRYDLRKLTALLNRAEVPADRDSIWEYQAGPVSLSAENSSLGQLEVLRIVEDWLSEHTEAQISAAYRADVREVYRFRKCHATFDSQERFSLAAQISFRPGAPYGGLHFLGAREAGYEGHLLRSIGGKHPLPFSVADDFYWNRK